MQHRNIWIVAAWLLATTANAQSHVGYVVHVVPGGTSATITGAYGGQLVGYISNGAGPATATHWLTRLSSPTVIAVDARILAIYGDRFVGMRNASGASRATLWYGTAGPVVDLHDPAAESSAALCLDGTRVGGAVTIGGQVIGRVWDGSAQGFVDLRSPSLGHTVVQGIGGLSQVGNGWSSAETWPRPLKWKGTTPSCRSLLVGGASQGSVVGMSGRFAAGTLTFEPTAWGGSSHREAYVWDAATEASRSLNPFFFSIEPADDSEATAIGGDKVAGSARWGAATYPFIWTWTGLTWVPQSLQGYAPGNPANVALTAVDPITGAIVGRADADSVVFSPVHSQLLETRVTGTASATLNCTEDLKHQTQSPFAISLFHPTPRTFLEYMKGRLVSLTPEPVTPSYDLLDRLEVDGVPWAGPISMDRDHLAEAFYKPGFPLTITSLSPDSGVAVTVWTADHAKRRNGSTPFVRAYEPAKIVSITAPVNPAPGRIFLHWARDGVVLPSPFRTVTLSMDAPHQMRAVYGSGGTLAFTASVNAVPIRVYQPDGFALRDGETPFQRFYVNGTMVAATAPPIAGSKPFLRWEKDGVAQPMGLQTVRISVSGLRTLRAVYSP